MRKIITKSFTIKNNIIIKRLTAMKIAIHQPNYLPYLGFFDKMEKSDMFVIYDDAQFNKSDFQHRNKIRIFNGFKWLTVPVIKKHIPIKEIKINNELKVKNLYWYDSHFENIQENYGKSAYFPCYKDAIWEIYSENYKMLFDLNIELINLIKEAFEIKCELVFSSELRLKSKSTQKIIDIVKELDGDTYLSGPKGIDYLDLPLFKKDRINVEFQDFKHPIYKQCYDDFVPNMSAIDALFNVGKYLTEIRR